MDNQFNKENEISGSAPIGSGEEAISEKNSDSISSPDSDTAEENTSPEGSGNNADTPENEELDLIFKTIKREMNKNKEQASDEKPVCDNDKTKLSSPAVKNEIEPSLPEELTKADDTEHKAPGESKVVYFDDIDGVKRGKKERQSKKERASFSVYTLFSGAAKTVLYIAFVAVCVYFLSTTCIKVGNDMFAFVKDYAEATITIPENATTKEVAEILHNNGIIEYPEVFEFYTDLRISRSAYLTGEYGSGEFEVNSSMNYDTLRSILALYETRKTVKITFREGMTTDEIIDLLVENSVSDRDSLVDAIQSFEYDNKFLKTFGELHEARMNPEISYRLEGYLFPDTYEFFTDENAVSVISKFINNFDVKFTDAHYKRLEELSMSVDEIVTLASVIEKEAGRHADFAIISSVFHNRLNSPQYNRLESDVTVMYGVKDHEYSAADNRVDGPYNTYINKGLPPGAICNPGIEAINAALYPEESSYYFFITDKDNVAICARTYDEHLANVRKYLD